MDKTARERQLSGLAFNTKTKEQLIEQGKEWQRKGLETRRKQREEQQSLQDLYKSISNSKACKKLVPEDVQEYAKERGINLDNRTALSIVQFIKALKGDTEAYKLILDISGEAPNQQQQGNQLSTIDAQRFLSEVSQILRKWITDKELLHNIVVDIMHIRTQ